MKFQLEKMFYQKKTCQLQQSKDLNICLQVASCKSKLVSHNIFKNQINVINNNREDNVKAEAGVKTEDCKITGNLNPKYSGDKYKNLIDNNIFKYGLMDGDLHLTYCDNQQLGLTNTLNTYLEKNIDVNHTNFEKPIKILQKIMIKLI